MRLSKDIEDCKFNHFLDSPNGQIILKAVRPNMKNHTENAVRSTVTLALHKDIII